MTTPSDLLRLRCGVTYRAKTRQRIVVGEYLGMEAPYGNRAILLRHDTGTDSISVRLIDSICATAA